MLYVPFLKLPETYNHPRLTEKISQLITRWEKPEHRDELRRFMRVWLAVGLVDPSGYYGDASLQTSADINANLGNWTVAGGIFQDIMPFEDLPKWARWEAIHTSMNGFSLWVEPADEEGDLDVARLMGNARWDAQIGDMLIAITPRESEYPKGVTLIGRKELSEKAHASTLLFADHDIERFTPAVIAADEDGLYLASVRIVEQGELVGEYDIDFALEPYNWRHTDLRIVTARRVNRIER